MSRGSTRSQGGFWETSVDTLSENLGSTRRSSSFRHVFSKKDRSSSFWVVVRNKGNPRYSPRTATREQTRKGPRNRARMNTAPPSTHYSTLLHLRRERALEWHTYTGDASSGRGRVYSCYAWPHSYDHGPSHPYNAGTEHVGFSPTRQTLLVPSAKRREILGGSHEE